MLLAGRQDPLAPRLNLAVLVKVDGRVLRLGHPRADMELVHVLSRGLSEYIHRSIQRRTLVNVPRAYLSAGIRSPTLNRVAHAMDFSKVPPTYFVVALHSSIPPFHTLVILFLPFVISHHSLFYPLSIPPPAREFTGDSCARSFLPHERPAVRVSCSW